MDVKDIIKWLLSHKIPEKASTARCVIVVIFIANVMVTCHGYETVKNQRHIINGTESSNLFNSGRPHNNSTVIKYKSALLNENNHEIVKQRVRSLMFTTTKYLKGYMKSLNEKGLGRTFGRPIKQLQAALLPVMFKLGVISTLVVLTFILVVKAVGIGLMLLMFKMAAGLAKLKSAFHEPHHLDHHGWSPHKEVHVHVHGQVPTGYASGLGSLFQGGGGHEPWSRLDPSITSLSGKPQLSYTAVQPGPSSINTPYGHYIRTVNRNFKCTRYHRTELALPNIITANSKQLYLEFYNVAYQVTKEVTVDA
ncbi:uncharacterized protein LOC143912558 [Arctopsyche grandis]|uniref:uncharacterized protein LOC143912558 n=1 Tax=Arctopsyche grandis TaxID=121162 RepID=UPI00406D83B7